MPFKIIRNDITKVNADVIVNTANPYPMYASGTDKAIYLAAGANKLLAEREKIGIIDRGTVAVTGAFDLQAKYIFHTVGPEWVDGNHGEFDILRLCYRNALEKAKALECESIAFPLIATGVYGFPKDKALQIALSEISGFLTNAEMLVYLVVFDVKAFKLSSQVIGQVDDFIDEHYVCQTREYEDTSNSRVGRSYTSKAIYEGVMKYKERELHNREIERDTEILSNVLFEQEGLEKCERVPLPIEGKTIISDNASLEEQLADMPGTFQELLFDMIKERGFTNAQVYKQSNLDRKHFSKIQCNVNYHPSKKTAMALCIGLRLNIEEARELLARAEWAFSPNRKMDLIVQNAIIHKNYDINQLNAILFSYGQECLGV